MIGRAFETWTDEQLRRVADAPDEAWVTCCAWAEWFRAVPGGCGCLAHKYFGYTKGLDADTSGWWTNPLFKGSGNYERLCRRYEPNPEQEVRPTPKSVITMLRNRARRILARRTLEALPERVVLEAR